MPIVNYEQYRKMLDAAAKGGYAYPAFNISNIETANAVLKGLAEAGSDGIIQVSTGGAAHASGSAINDSVIGAITLANHVHLLAEKYNVFVALHTDHCQSKKVDSFLIPLIEETERRRAAGQPNLFNSHMFDGSDIPLKDNLVIARKLLERCAKNEIILEVEAGVVGGEEDGVIGAGEVADPAECAKITALGIDFLAAGIGNIHGKYPANWKGLDFEALDKIHAATDNIPLVLHGGTGIPADMIKKAISLGVSKINVNTECQLSFAAATREYIEAGKDQQGKGFDPRKLLAPGAEAIKATVREKIELFGSANKA